MFYNYAPLLLAALGTIAGATGYYLNMVLPAGFDRLFWGGATFLFIIVGFTNGRLIQRLHFSSHTDYLTGLWNRRYFYLKLAEEEARANRKQTPLCVAMIDVDDFKRINDTYGHAIGDVLLSDLSAILRKNTRGTDIVVRWGGDEFAIIFSETPLAEVLEVTERVRRKVEMRFQSSYGLTISIGVMPLKRDQDLQDMIISADQALYKAKEQKNAVTTVAEFSEIILRRAMIYQQRENQI